MGKDDHALIRAVLSGDKNAYGALVARHGENMFRVAYRIARAKRMRKRLSRRLFFADIAVCADFDARADFRTWIYRIAVNCALQALNKRRSQAAVPIAEEFDDERPAIQLADRGAGPERLLLDREIEHRRQAAMEKMTPDERLAFVLRHLEGRSTEEIAAALQVTPNNAKQAVFRAVQKMRRSLAPLWVKS